MFIHPITARFTPNVCKYGSLKQNTNTYAQNPISFTGDDYFDYDDILKKKLDARPGWKKLFGAGKKKAKQETQLELVGFTRAQSKIADEKEKQLEMQERLLAQKEETLKQEREKTELYKQQLQMAKEANAKDSIILELKAKLEASQKKAAAAQTDYNMQAQRVEGIKHEQAILTKREKGKGWDKIAGHEDLKQQIEEAFINKLALEKNGCDVNLPNGILFYGQHGTGKTRFAQAFAEQAGCRFVEINTMQSDEDVIDDLHNELKKAKKAYFSPETPKKRTIILLDDFDSIAKLNQDEEALLQDKGFDFNDTNVGQLSEILSNCADKYKATIFMTTNHPRKVSSELLTGDRTPYQVFLGPPNPLDASKIFKYHLNGFTDAEIDYIRLGNEVGRAIDDGVAYSAQGIVDVVDYAKENKQGSQVTEPDLLDAIQNVEPDISKETFDAFLDDMAELRALYEGKGEE